MFIPPLNRPLVLHVISGLGTGGAELMLYRLIQNARDVRHAVVSLRDLGTVGPALQDLDIAVVGLNIKPATAALAPFQIARLSRQLNAAVVQGWMTHGNAFATLASTLNRRPALLWNVRQSIFDFTFERRSTAALIRFSARISNRADAILYNSRVAQEQHERLGYASRRPIFIPNGFDIAAFRRAATARNEIRQQLGVQDKLVIGMVGRFHPMKNHAGFVRVAREFAEARQDANFILAGLGTDGDEMQQLLSKEGLQDRTLLLGERKDVAALTSAFDIGLSISLHGEGFPNVVGEAMSCGVPCVVADVGDAGWVLGKGGIVVEPGDEQATVRALIALADAGDDGRRKIGAEAARRAASEFSIEKVTSLYEELYIDFARPSR